ncbi:phosphatase PAP2 family protein [Trinickia sp. YCB016]
MWNVFTNIGDAAVTLPVAAICAGWIAVFDVRLACRWIAALAAGMVVVGATKILYYGWGLSLAASGLRVVSGHTMLSTAVWIVAIALQLKWWRLPPLLGIVAGMVVGVLTGIARVMDHSHSLPEVLSGWVLGALVAAVFLRSALKVEFERPWPMGSAISLLLVSALAYGHQAPLQDLIETHAPEIHERVPSVVALFHPFLYRIQSHVVAPAR